MNFTGYPAADQSQRQGAAEISRTDNADRGGDRKEFLGHGGQNSRCPLRDAMARLPYIGFYANQEAFRSTQVREASQARSA